MDLTQRQQNLLTASVRKHMADDAINHPAHFCSHKDFWICNMMQNEEGIDDATFIALARNAFDVMMRRGWTMERTISGTWNLPLSLRWVADGKLWDALSGKFFPDQFTGLVEADKWFREHVEAVKP